MGSGAGVAASVPDAAYQAVGAEVSDAAGAFAAELVLKVRTPFDNEAALMKPGTVVVGMLNPFDAAGLQRLAAAGLGVLVGLLAALVLSLVGLSCNKSTPAAPAAATRCFSGVDASPRA